MNCIGLYIIKSIRTVITEKDTRIFKYQDITQSDYTDNFFHLLCSQFELQILSPTILLLKVLLSISLSKNCVWFQKYIMDKNKVILNFILKFCDDIFLHTYVYVNVSYVVIICNKYVIKKVVVNIHQCTYFFFIKRYKQNMHNHSALFVCFKLFITI